jgi:hypothetical protein
MIDSNNVTKQQCFIVHNKELYHSEVYITGVPAVLDGLITGFSVRPMFMNFIVEWTHSH